MTDRHVPLERAGNFLAVVAAALLASVMVALAQVSDIAEPAQPQPAVPVRIVLTQPVPRHALVMPEVISQGDAAGDALKKLVAEHRCLAEVMYFEARGEGEAGMRAVAQVILHRLAEGAHGRTICNVIYEGAGQSSCQFTFVCDGLLDLPRVAESWRAAQVLAARMLVGEGQRMDDTAGATYFHAVLAHPTWAPKLERIVQIGNHVFYRSKAPALRVAFRGPLQ